MMRCDGCDLVVDTDDDPDSLYEIDGDCLCETCRDRWARNQRPEPFEDTP